MKENEKQNTYLLIITHNDINDAYTTTQSCWQDALIQFAKFCGLRELTHDEFEQLISNKTSDYAIQLYNRFSYDEIKFFGIIHSPFVNNLININEITEGK